LAITLIFHKLCRFTSNKLNLVYVT